MRQLALNLDLEKIEVANLHVPTLENLLSELQSRFATSQSKHFFECYLRQAFGESVEPLTPPAIRCFVNAQSRTFAKETNNLVGDIELAPVVVRQQKGRMVLTEKSPPGIDTMNFGQTSLLFDSGAFPEVRIDRRITPEQALERQLSQLAVFPTMPKETWLVSYDRLIDEKYVDGDRVKQRWSVEEATLAVEQTVDAAKYLNSQRYKLEGITLVQSCQGVDALQYLSCVEQVLGFCLSNDVLGLGGWCILGKQRKWLPTFWETIQKVVPAIASAGIKKVHIFGVTWWKGDTKGYSPLGSLLWLCDRHGIELSCDGRSPIGNALWKSESGNSIRKSGALHPYWRANLALVRTYMATLRDLPEYQPPPTALATQLVLPMPTLEKKLPGRPKGKLNNDLASGCFYHQHGKRWIFQYHKSNGKGGWQKTSKVVPPDKVNRAKDMKINGASIEEILNFIGSR